MSGLVGREYGKWVAPRKDGEVLVWPGGRGILRDTWENHRQLQEEGGEVMVAGVPLPILRRWMRRWLGHGEDQRPIVATGHQTEVHHPGVWIKNAVIDAVVRRIGGEAIHFAVDTDAPKHLVYRWPGGGRVLTDDAGMSQARWCGLLGSPTAGYVEEVRREAEAMAAGWGMAPAWGAFWERLGRAAGMGENLAEGLSQAHLALDRGLGLKYQSVLASRLTRTTGYLLFVCDIACRAEEYAEIYNGALREYRAGAGISSPGRPMPDLNRGEDWCEIPFWLDDLDGSERSRARLERVSGGWGLRFEGAEFVFERGVGDGFAVAEALGAFLARTRLRIAPRALTLTSFLRVGVVDQFVHGIGGAVYDQVTDRILERWYGMAPPKFSVATATVYSPEAAGRERTCLECLIREGRQLRHGVLGEEKMRMVGQIEALPRRSAERAMMFSQMHRAMDAAVEKDARIEEQVRRLAAARAEFEADRMIFDRELPYGEQARERLEGLIEKVRSEVE